MFEAPSSVVNNAVRAPLVVVGGGVRSGKSRLGMDLALACGPRRAFIATAQPFDDEMQERILRHRTERDGRFETIELARELASVAQALPRFDVVLVDCLTLYVSNWLLALSEEELTSQLAVQQLQDRISGDLRRGVEALRGTASRVILITNEVGMGVVPASRLGRLFRDLAGTVNQWISGEATEVWWCALGIPLRIKPSPVVALDDIRSGDNS